MSDTSRHVTPRHASFKSDGLVSIAIGWCGHGVDVMKWLIHAAMNLLRCYAVMILHVALLLFLT